MVLGPRQAWTEEEARSGEYAGGEEAADAGIRGKKLARGAGSGEAWQLHPARELVLQRTVAESPTYVVEGWTRGGRASSSARFNPRARKVARRAANHDANAYAMGS
jgi:hypothetical protein